jgi:hypothetical protein
MAQFRREALIDQHDGSERLTRSSQIPFVRDETERIALRTFQRGQPAHRGAGVSDQRRIEARCDVVRRDRARQGRMHRGLPSAPCIERAQHLLGQVDTR